MEKKKTQITLNILNKFHFILFAQIINAAAHQNREGVLQKSREMKFLTGYESKVQSRHHRGVCSKKGDTFTYIGHI